MIKKSAIPYVVNKKKDDEDGGFLWQLVVVGAKKTLRLVFFAR